MTEYDRTGMTPAELVLAEIIQDEIITMSELLGVNIIAALGIAGHVYGRIAACLDESLKDNPEIRAKLVVPGMEHMMTGSDSHDCFMKNYNAMRDRHIKHHEEKRAKGAAAVDELFERLNKGVKE